MQCISLPCISFHNYVSRIWLNFLIVNVAADTFFFLLSYLFTHNINFVYSIYRFNYMENISNNCGWQYVIILCVTGAQVRTVIILVGTQVVTEAVILSVTGVWHTQGASRIRRQCYKKVFQVMMVNIGPIKVAYCLNILNMINPMDVNLWLIRLVLFYFVAFIGGQYWYLLFSLRLIPFFLDFDRSLIWHCVSLSWSHFAVVIYCLQVGFLWLGIFRFQKPCSFFVIPIVLTFMALWLW